jgi:hypothetical protein
MLRRSAVGLLIAFPTVSRGESICRILGFDPSDRLLSPAIKAVGQARHLGRLYSDGSEARSQYCLGHRIEIAARRVKVHQSWSDFTVRLSRSNYGCAD